MKKYILLAAIAIASTSALASPSVATMARIGTKVIEAGDPVSKVRSAAEPDSKEDLINNFDVKKGEVWHFTSGNSQADIYINNDGIVYKVAQYTN